MPPMKVQPIDSPTMRGSIQVADPAKVVLKSRLRRLFDRQFRASSTEKPIIAVGETEVAKECAGGLDFEPSSVCLAKMVQNFIEESNDRQLGAANAAKCGRSRCNCFNGKSNDSSDGDFDDSWGESTGNSPSHGDLYELIKSLVPCASMAERNLLADTAKIVENHSFKKKDELREIIIDGLCALGYDASICKSAWDKTSSYPAGEYEYIDVVMAEGSERLIIDVDFRSEFEIARATGTYKTILQSLPFIFVGNADRLQQIVVALSEAAKQSLKKKGMHIPPWRKADYMKSKWLSPCTRSNPSLSQPNDAVSGDQVQLSSSEKNPELCTVVEVEDEVGGVLEKTLEKCAVVEKEAETETGELELIFGDQFSPAESNSVDPTLSERDGGVMLSTPPVAVVRSPWQPPALRPRISERRGGKVVTGLASLLKEKL